MVRHVSFPFDFGKKYVFIHLLSYSQKCGEKHASAITWYQRDLSQKCCLLRMRNRNFLASQQSFASLPMVPGPVGWHSTNFQPKPCHDTYCELSCLPACCPAWGRIKGLRIQWFWKDSPYLAIPRHDTSRAARKSESSEVSLGLLSWSHRWSVQSAFTGEVTSHFLFFLWFLGKFYSSERYLHHR